jgi:hypothetical protein
MHESDLLITLNWIIQWARSCIADIVTRQDRQITLQKGTIIQVIWTRICDNRK